MLPGEGQAGGLAADREGAACWPEGGAWHADKAVAAKRDVMLAKRILMLRDGLGRPRNGMLPERERACQDGLFILFL